MANKPTPTAPTEEKKKRGVAKGTKREPKWNGFNVKYSVNAENFDPQNALQVYAESLGLIFTDVVSKNRAGDETGKHTLVFSTTPITKRAKAIMSKDAEKEALALFRASMRDPEKAKTIEKLLERSRNGEDTSSEMSALIGVK